MQESYRFFFHQTESQNTLWLHFADSVVPFVAEIFIFSSTILEIQLYFRLYRQEVDLPGYLVFQCFCDLGFLCKHVIKSS